MPVDSQLLDVPGGKIWVRKTGQGEGIPCIVIHGGPGFPHDYLLDLEALGKERPLIFYDQLGCGRSERPDDTSLWTVARAVLELGAVREHFQLNSVHLFGHSWGAIPAVEYFLSGAQGVKSLVLASPALNLPRWSRDAMELRQKLAPKYCEALTQGEAERDFTSASYQRALDEYYRQFVFGGTGVPQELQKSMSSSGAQVYQTLWGYNEFFLNGRIRDYNCTSRLKEINCPILLNCGRNDEATPGAILDLQKACPKAEVQIFEKSAHLPHITQKTDYLSALSRFFSEVEQGNWKATSPESPKSFGEKEVLGGAGRFSRLLKGIFQQNSAPD